MAPTATKRARPSFSPPRPGKSKVTKSKEANTSNLDGATNQRNKKNTSAVAAGKTTAPRNQPPKKKQTARRRGTGGTMKAILGVADEDENEDEADSDTARGHEESDPDSESAASDDNEDDDHEEEEDEQENPADTDPTSSPEPEFILAEVVPNTSWKSIPGSSDSNIPLPLVHRIMQAHFTAPEKTSVSADARALFGTYVEIFVKEAIRRCVDEKKDREGVGGGGVDSGWLELEDLERVATQLCLDF